MCRYVVIGLLVLLVVLMAVAAVVVQEYGWTGFLIVILSLVALGYLARLALPRLIRYLFNRSLRQMGAPLLGARITVHAVTPCEPPPPDEYEDAPEAIADRQDPEDEDDEEEFVEDDEDDQDDEDEGPYDWYRIELTVTPKDAGSSEGRMVTRRAWSPGMIEAVGPRPPLGSADPFRGWPPPDQFPGSVRTAEVEAWDGQAYRPETEQLFGERRLRLWVGVSRSVSEVTITYAHFVDVGRVPIPRLNISPEGRP